MKKWLMYVASTLLILAFMVQMGWLEIIGIHRVSFGSGRTDEARRTDTQAYVTEDGVSYRVKAEGDYFICTRRKMSSGKRSSGRASTSARASRGSFRES